ncbi:MAG: signal peptide peptidase SppA [Acidobacteriota bacterium]
MQKRNVAILLVFAVFVLAMIAVGLLLVSSFGKSSLGFGGVAAGTILEVDFETAVLEYIPPDPVAQLTLQETPQVRDLVEALVKAADDDRIVGLVARVGQGGMGVAQLQEIRDAVLAFRAGGKPAYAFAETFGEVNTGNSSYYLATAFDKIFLQQSGDVNITGLLVDNPFLRGMLEKIGVEPRMDHRHEFKNAMNMFTETELTEAHREASRALMTSIFDQMVAGMAEGRNMTQERFRELIAAGPFYGQEALDNGLVDALAYRDEVYAQMRDAAGSDSSLLYLGAYLDQGRAWNKGEAIALIYGVGGITRGESQFNAASGSATMGSDTVAAALRAAVADDDVRAILFRIDCNGGSYVASDTVLREVKRAQEAGKPVIVSMGNVAASGGYFVALSADKIVAQPSTITASIGVLGGKLLTNGLWEKIGLSWDGVATSANASMWSSTHDYDEAQWERHTFWLDRVYEDFTTKVAEGRDLPIERVREIAKGRVWTGAQAKENGLVDELGGFPVALRLAREAIGLTADASIELRSFPPPRTFWEELMADGPTSSEAAVVAMARMLETVRPMARMAERIGLIETYPKTLALPEDMIPRP